MNVLGVDTSSKKGSVALVKGNRVVDEIVSDSAVSFSRSLLGMIDSLLLRCKLKLDDLSGLAVANGPGSFTGIRIGIATIQGISLSSSLPVYGISTLESMASMVKSLVKGPFVTMMEAGRGFVYSARFAYAGGSLERLADDSYSTVQESLAGGGAAVFGNGIKEHEQAIRSAGDGYEDFSGFPEGNSIAAGAAMAASGKMEAGEKGEILFLKPNYIRRSSAEIVLERRKG